MIKVSVMYPNGPGRKFDVAYYSSTHMPVVRRRRGVSLQRIAVEHRLAAGAPGAPPPILAFGHSYFESVAAFQGAFVPHGEAIMADTPNYTNTVPAVQISNVCPRGAH